MMNSFESTENGNLGSDHGRKNDRLVSRVARMYHEEGLKQSEIASKLRFSQGTVCRLLRKAEERRIIRTTVNAPIGTFVDLEELIERKFGLRQAIIAHSPYDSIQESQNGVGAAARHFLEMALKPNSVIGVSASESLSCVVKEMHHVWKVSDCKVVQVIGAAGNEAIETDSNYLIQQLADLVEGEAYLLAAPGILAQDALSDSFRQDAQVRETLDLFDRISIGLFEINSIMPGPCLSTEEEIILELLSLERSGAVGQLCFRFYDIDGREKEASFGNRVFGLQTSQIKKIPVSVGIGFGQEKRSAILGALRGGWINVLITDQYTAQSLLGDLASTTAFVNGNGMHL